jgi:hypothetical protein
MERTLRIWLRAGWRTYAVGAAGRYLTNDREDLLLIPNTGAVELLT